MAAAVGSRPSLNLQASFKEGRRCFLVALVVYMVRESRELRVAYLSFFSKSGCSALLFCMICRSFLFINRNSLRLTGSISLLYFL